MTEWLHFHFSLSCIKEGNGNPLQCSCLENPRDGGAWWAAVYGVAQSRTRLKWLSSSSPHSQQKSPKCSTWVQSQKPRNDLCITGKFGLGVQNEAGQMLTVLPRECTGHSKHPLPIIQEKILHMDITRWPTEIRLIIFFAAKDGEALYSQQKQDQELTVAQTMNSLLPNSDLNWRK